MKIIIDERERDLYSLVEAGPPLPEGVVVEKQTLDIGDVLFYIEGGEGGAAAAEPSFIFERKTIPDLLASIHDGRYAEQSFRLRHCFPALPRHRIVYILEGVLTGYTRDNKNTVYSTIASLNQFKGVSVLRTMDLEETRDVLLQMAVKIDRDLFVRKKTLYGGGEAAAATDYGRVVHSVKKQNITRSNIGAIMLSQIPGVSVAAAETLLAPFDSLYAFLGQLQTDARFVYGVSLETAGGKKRKIGKNVAEKIYAFLGPAAAQPPP
jgi:ERCC4-type nuclease